MSYRYVCDFCGKEYPNNSKIFETRTVGRHVCVECMQKRIREYAERLAKVDYSKQDCAIVFAVHNDLAEALVRLNLKD